MKQKLIRSVPSIDCPSSSPISNVLMEVVQRLANMAAPRGFPRLVWIFRRFLVGGDVRRISYLRRFKLLCDSDSYPSVMASSGVVYRRMDRILKAILKPHMVFIDVGANVGFVSLLASSTIDSREGAVSTHCFEPDPTVYPWLALNRELNPDLKMVVNQVAIGSERGEGELTVSARSGWSTMAKEPPEGFAFLPKAGKVKVPVTTLDLYCSENKLTPGVIKIDVEGLEKQVLNGAGVTLRQFRPYIFIEINPLRLAAAGTSGEELIAQTVGFGYTLFHVDPALAKNSNGLKRSNWLELTEALPNDLVMGQDFDVIAVPTELLLEPV